MRWSLSLLLIFALNMGCTDEVSTIVNVDLLYPEDEGAQDPLEGVERLVVQIVPTDGFTEPVVRELLRPSSGWSGMNEGIDLGMISIEWARVVIDGLDADGEVLSAGESIPVPIMVGHSGQISLFFQRLGTSGLAPSLSEQLSHHSATYLEGGGVLLAGGDEGTPSDEAWVYAMDLYEPIKIESLPGPTGSRALSEVTSFSSTKALLVGGSGASTTALTYTPSTNSWSEVPLPAALHGPWPRPLLAELPGGSALAVKDLAVVRFDPGAIVEEPGELASEAALAGETLTVLTSDSHSPSQLAMIVGEEGVVGLDYIRRVEVAVEQPPSGGRTGHGAAVLSDGRLVIAGGESAGELVESVDVYDTNSEQGWSELPELLAGQGRHGARLSALRDDRLLLSGGEDSGGNLARDAVVIDVETEEITLIPLVIPRLWHTATVLSTGAVMIAGGEDSQGDPLASVEIIRP